MERPGSPTSPLVAWAAGIFEGEGSIVMAKQYVRLQVKMTDEDVVRRLGEVLGGNVTGPYQYGTRKPAWVWGVSGKRAVLIALLLAPWLGVRRRARLTEFGIL